MTRAALRSVILAAAIGAVAGPAQSQGQAVGASAPSRLAEDRRVDEGSRQTQAARQTEAPQPAEARRQPDAPAKSEARPSFQRQAEPQRQPEPQRQREPQHQAESSRRNDSDHWKDPGPAWRPVGPAWRDLNDRPSVPRPGQDAFRAKPNTYAPRDRGGRRDGDSRRGGVVRKETVYVPYPYVAPFDLAPYYFSPLDPEPAPAPAAPAPRDDDRPLGFLQLRVQPRTAEVFVDGAFAGTVDDFGGRGARMLPAGPHRVEIIADGYETLTFDVRVPENDTVTFTRELEPRVERPGAEPAVVPHKTMYIVPKCFIGDRPPLVSDMPAGCRVEDVRVIP
ncbi:MAG TPA: PEGA domain-containing protein [Vicinamibacterales bacterium]|nr:PEGA domain-containing protein [Vicinamibacterales bacterium]